MYFFSFHESLQVAEGTVDMIRADEGEVALSTSSTDQFPTLINATFAFGAQATTAFEQVEGFLTFQGDEAVFARNAGPWLRRFVRFDGCALYFWQYPEHVGKREPEVRACA